MELNPESIKTLWKNSYWACTLSTFFCVNISFILKCIVKIAKGISKNLLFKVCLFLNLQMSREPLLPQDNGSCYLITCTWLMLCSSSFQEGDAQKQGSEHLTPTAPPHQTHTKQDWVLPELQGATNSLTRYLNADCPQQLKVVNDHKQLVHGHSPPRSASFLTLQRASSLRTREMHLSWRAGRKCLAC